MRDAATAGKAGLMDDAVPDGSSESSDAPAKPELRKLIHDLNNALMPILLGVDALRRKSHDPALERTLSNIEKATNRAAEIVAELLRVAPKS
jgi:hypothetical protein